MDASQLNLPPIHSSPPNKGEADPKGKEHSMEEVQGQVLKRHPSRKAAQSPLAIRPRLKEEDENLVLRTAEQICGAFVYEEHETNSDIDLLVKEWAKAASLVLARDIPLDFWHLVLDLVRLDLPKVSHHRQNGKIKALYPLAFIPVALINFFIVPLIMLVHIDYWITLLLALLILILNALIPVYSTVQTVANIVAIVQSIYIATSRLFVKDDKFDKIPTTSSMAAWMYCAMTTSKNRNVAMLDVLGYEGLDKNMKEHYNELVSEARLCMNDIAVVLLWTHLCQIHFSLSSDQVGELSRVREHGSKCLQMLNSRSLARFMNVPMPAMKEDYQSLRITINSVSFKDFDQTTIEKVFKQLHQVHLSDGNNFFKFEYGPERKPQAALPVDEEDIVNVV